MSCQQAFKPAQLVELALLYNLYPTAAGLKTGVKNQRQSKYMQYFNNSKNNVLNFNPYNSLALFTADNIRPSADRAISPASLLLYHYYFPCTCLPAVSLVFVYRRLLNPLLETLPSLLGSTTKEGLHVTCHISGLTNCY